MTTLLKPGALIDIPPDVAICPYCNKPLTARPTAWTQQDDGTWTATESGLECNSQPPIDSEDAWDDWVRQHTYMTQVHWLPVDQVVLAWLAGEYRFECGDGQRRKARGA